MDYQLELVPGSYVYFRPLTIPTSGEEVTRRRQAIGDYARTHGIPRVMLDYRDRKLPPDLPHFDVVVAAWKALVKYEWRVAFLISPMAPGDSAKLLQGLARLLVGMTLNAACFTDREQAEVWLMSEDPPPQPEKLPD